MPKVLIMSRLSEVWKNAIRFVYFYHRLFFCILLWLCVFQFYPTVHWLQQLFVVRMMKIKCCIEIWGWQEWKKTKLNIWRNPVWKFKFRLKNKTDSNVDDFIKFKSHENNLCIVILKVPHKLHLKTPFPCSLHSKSSAYPLIWRAYNIREPINEQTVQKLKAISNNKERENPAHKLPSSEAPVHDPTNW